MNVHFKLHTSNFTLQSSFLRRVSVFGAIGAIVVALMGLLGYVPGLGLLGSVREGFIPMAPSTAVSFIVLGGILLVMTFRSLSGASLILFGALAALVSLFGAFEIAGHFTGKDLNFENALVPSAGYLGEIPVARMSPSTGALFFLAGLAALALLLRVRTHGRGTRFGHWAGSLGSLVLGISLLFCLAHVFGIPLLYGQGATVPMALTTALAFLMLGAAAVGASGKDAIPVSLLAGAKRAGEHMNARSRILLLALIMVAACAMVIVVMMVILYHHEIKKRREMLQVTAQSRARLIEAVARHDARMADLIREKNPDHDASADTLSQIIDAHERFEGFGETGEFTLARRDGDSIVFVLRHRHDTIEHPVPVAFDSDLAEPMRLALEGLSGTIIALDYRGKTVVAAHEPVAVLNLGIVAKIDLAEVREPFIRAGFSAAAVALLVVLAGMALFIWIGNPIIARLEAYSRDLEKKVEERKRVEEELRMSNRALTVLSECNQTLVRATDEGDLLHSACRILVKKGAYRLAWVGFAEQDEGKSVRPVAQMGYDEGYLDTLNITWADTERGRGPTGSAIRTGRPVVARYILTDSEFAPWREAALERGYASSIALPLMAGERAFGALNVYSSEPDTFSEQETGLLVELADDLAYGIMALRIREEHRRAEAELAKHREHLEELVEERTTQLRERVAETEELNSAMVNVMEDLRSSNVELEAMGRELMASNMELDAFSYSVSHDLRVPLRHIAGFVNLLKESTADSLDSTSQRHLAIISESAERMGHLIDDLLAFSRAGRVELHKTDLDLQVLIKEVVREEMEQAKGRDIAWEIEVLPEVHADRATLRQVLVNLIDNAVKYTRECEQAHIEIGTVPGEENQLVFFVRDNGVGFDMKYADKLFGVFQRLHSTEQFEGTGVGLANVRRIIHRHGGRTWAEGKVDEGATFYFSLPLG